MPSEPAIFYPFYDPYRGGETLGYGSKVGISLGLGVFYALLQYYSLADKMVFFQQYCWILGIVISTSVLTLYIATDIFRRSLVTIGKLEGDTRISEQVIRSFSDDKWYFLAGLCFATLNTSVGHILGVPTEFHVNVFPLVMIYVGFFMAGFAAGMGLLAIFTVIMVYLKLAPELQHSLDPNNPDGNGGIKKLGDSLWFFALLIGTLGVLISIYMFRVQWVYAFKDYVQVIFVIWVAVPYIVAISVVLIPGLAVRRQVNYFKVYKAKQLKLEKTKVYSSYKQFEEKEDSEIIEEKKELNEKLIRIQDELEKLKKMRASHIDRSSD